MYQIFETIRQDREGRQVNYSVVQEAIMSLGKEPLLVVCFQLCPGSKEIILCRIDSLVHIVQFS